MVFSMPGRGGRAEKEEKKDTPGRRSRRRIARPLPVRSLIPNSLTVLALCVGLTSVRFGLDGNFEAAVAAIIAATVLDGLDGRIARMLQGVTKFGAELDSLTDFVNFGVAPVLLLYLWSLEGLGRVGWIIILCYAVCCALRLARFNVGEEEPDKPFWKSNFFIGVPAPVAAMLVMFPLYLSFESGINFREWPMIVAIHTGVVALLMVSRIPTYSAKHMGIRIPGDKVLLVLLLVALGGAVLVSYPWVTVMTLSLCYIVLMPLGVVRYQWLLKRSEARKEKELQNP